VKSSGLTRILFVMTLGTTLALVYHFMVADRAVLSLDLDTDTRTILKVYWPNQDGLYTEKNMARINIRPGIHDYRLRICDLGITGILRIDPSERPARVVIHSMDISEEGYPSLHYDGKSGLDRLAVIRGIKTISHDSRGIAIVPSDHDPQLQLILPPMPRGPVLVHEAFRVAAIFFLVFFLQWALTGMGEQYRYVPCLLLFVLALVVVMASISKYNHHPDEFVHVRAAEYYQTHLLPPEIEAREILNTYSVYGVSRLHSGEIVYFLAGRFLLLARPLHLPSYLVLRFFNVFLLACLIALALRQKEFRLFLLPLLISSQAWYVFSYFNSDAFALFIILLCGYQMAVSESLLNRFFARGMRKSTWIGLPAGALLFGLLLLLKKNFYFFYVFLALYTVWKVYMGAWHLEKNFIYRFCTVILAACLVFAFWRGLDYRVNGFDQGRKLLQAREHLALKMYKPSTPLPEKHPYLQMKDRGVSLRQFLELNRWGEKSFRSSFGVFGYMSVSAPFVYYDIVRVIGLLLLGVVLLPVLFRGGRIGMALAAITVTVSGSLLVVAMYHAWTVDFQAQGRYFLPILGMAGVYMYHVQRWMFHSLLNIFVGAMFLLAAYNFVFVGLMGIGKYGC